MHKSPLVMYDSLTCDFPNEGFKGELTMQVLSCGFKPFLSPSKSADRWTVQPDSLVATPVYKWQQRQKQ